MMVPRGTRTSDRVPPQCRDPGASPTAPNTGARRGEDSQISPPLSFMLRNRRRERAQIIGATGTADCSFTARNARINQYG